MIAGAIPTDVATVGESPSITIRANKLGTVVTGKPGDLVIDYAARFDGPVYDVMYNPRTGWFVVTIYRGLQSPARWDNRPDTNNGYRRVGDVLGATGPSGILAALDIDPEALGYAPA